MKPVTILVIGLSVAIIACTPAAPDGTSQTATADRPLRKPDVRYEPTPHRIVRVMLDLADVRPGDLVYDLGSGDGRIPIAAARLHGARGVGIDIDPQRVAEADANARSAAVVDRVSFRNEDLLEADFSDATVVTLFLSADLNLKLRPRLLRDLRPGTRIVSYYHDMGDWKPARTVPTDRANIYLWTIPAR